MKMKLSISNIAWEKERDEQVYDLMQKHGFTGLEIAPTRIFPESPYDQAEEAGQWAEELKRSRNFTISSLQSIWYGRTERLFGTAEERQALLSYTKKAIDFAERLGCRNLVFGCPHNRSLGEGEDERVAISFFRELGDYAARHHTVLAMEANPPIYHTNYINRTAEALALVKRVDSEGFLLNLDVGTMIQNGETVAELEGNMQYVNHVHISEPGLKPIERRKLHGELMQLLGKSGYEGFVSIEMGKQEDLTVLTNCMDYGRKQVDNKK